jgi:hypothetical protein
MKSNRIIFLFAAALLALGAAFCLALGRPVQAASQPGKPALQMTPFPTPTPGPDGRIIYIVQPNDTLLRISLISGVSLDELRALNNIVGDNIVEGQQLLLGLAGPAEPTLAPGVTVTPTSILPTPTAPPGLGTICILLFEDINGDAIREETELPIVGGEVSLSNRSGSISETGTTIGGEEPLCYENLGEGNFSITMGIPDGYNPTTVTNYSLTLNAGDRTYLDFGAQKNSQAVAELPVASGGESQRSPLMGIIGGALLVFGVALAFFARRLLKSG